MKLHTIVHSVDVESTVLPISTMYMPQRVIRNFPIANLAGNSYFLNDPNLILCLSFALKINSFFYFILACLNYETPVTEIQNNNEEFMVSMSIPL